MDRASDSGMLDDYQSFSNVTGFCPTGECNWQRHSSLAICTSFEDVTNDLVRMNGSNGTSSISKNNTYAQDISLPLLGSPPPPILSDPGDPQNFFVYSLVHRNLVFPLKRFTPAVTEAQIPDIANVYLVYGDRCQDYRYSSTHKVSYYIAFKATMRLCIQTYDSSYKIGMNTSVVSEHNDLTWSGERDNCRDPWSQRDHRFSSDSSNNLTTASSSAARVCTNNCTEVVYEPDPSKICKYRCTSASKDAERHCISDYAMQAMGTHIANNMVASAWLGPPTPERR